MGNDKTKFEAKGYWFQSKRERSCILSPFEKTDIHIWLYCPTYVAISVDITFTPWNTIFQNLKINISESSEKKNSFQKLFYGLTGGDSPSIFQGMWLAPDPWAWDLDRSIINAWRKVYICIHLSVKAFSLWSVSTVTVLTIYPFVMK